MNDKKKFSIVLFIFAIITFLLLINVVFVSNIYMDQEYLFASTGVGTSMEPYIENGDTVIVITADHPDFDIKVGDVIVYYMDDGTAVAHRVYHIDDERYFVKGDNNELRDQWSVKENQIVGKVYEVIRHNNFLQRSIVGLILDK